MEQSSSQMKKVFAILIVALFVVQLTAIAVSADDRDLSTGGGTNSGSRGKVDIGRVNILGDGLGDGWGSNGDKVSVVRHHPHHRSHHHID